MPHLIQILTNDFEKAAICAFPEYQNSLLIEITPSTSAQFGHYQCNSAMKLGKELQTNPRQIAQKWVDQLQKEAAFIKKIQQISIAGPGFINITLHPTYISDTLNEIAKDPYLGTLRGNDKKRIVVDFSSPNVAKEMHVGHLRSTIIGDSIARLLEFLGHDVLRLNHIGDWGTQFGMLIAYLKEKYPLIFSGKEQADLEQLVAWYKESKAQFDNDPIFKKQAQLEVVALQSGQKESLKAWQTLCQISRVAFEEIYHLLDIRLNERGESYYNPMLAPLVDDLQKRGLLTISDGAKCLYLDGFVGREGEPLPLILQKSDGGFNYDTTDMAALKHRIEEEKAERIIYITDAGQSLHFQMLFKGAEKIEIVDLEKVEVEHISFGVVLGPDGKKFKTRSGETVKLKDLILKGIDRAKELLQARYSDWSAAEIEKTAHVLGIDAIKYADLSTQRTGDYTFSYDKMLRFEGNTAAFLLYSYVRIASIKRKVTTYLPAPIAVDHPSEIQLGAHLLRFSEILQTFSKDLYPHRLAEYLYDLANYFNAFFRDCRVEGSETQNSRLALCDVTAATLKQGMEILGLSLVERM